MNKETFILCYELHLFNLWAVKCFDFFIICSKVVSFLLQETSEVGKAGKKVREMFYKLVDSSLPDYSTYARKQDSPEAIENDRKKRKHTPPPQAQLKIQHAGTAVADKAKETFGL